MRAWLLGLMSVAVVMMTVRPPPLEPSRDSDLRPVLLRSSLAKTLFRPYVPLLIDVMWLRALNAIGLADSARKNLALYEYGRAITDLDPRFYEAYKYIGLNVPFQYGYRQFVNGEQAEDLLRRGVGQFPSSIPLHIYLGYNLFEIQRKYREASQVFTSLSRIEGAPEWARPLAARLLSHDGSPRDALSLTDMLLSDAPDEETRAYLENLRTQLLIEVQLAEVDRAIEVFRARRGNLPATVADLVAEGVYDGPAVDPTGGMIIIGPDGKAASTALSRRVKLYE